MTKPLKIAAIILVISAGLLGSYWIIKDAKKADSETAGFSLENAIKPGGTLFKYIEKATQDIQGAIPNNGATSTIALDNALPANAENSSNLTEMIAKIVAGKIIEKNKSGLAKTETGEPKLLMPDEKVLLQELTNQLANLNTGSLNLNQPINEVDLKISKNNSKEAQIKYIESIGKISKTNFGKLDKNILDSLKETTIIGDTYSLQKAVEAYKSTIDNYLELEIPSDWLNFHKQAITHFQNAVVVYGALADFQNDPIKAHLAIEIVEQLITNAQSIQNQLNQKIKEIGL